VRVVGVHLLIQMAIILELELELELERELEENPALEKVQEETKEEEFSAEEGFEDEGTETIDTDFDVNDYLFDDDPAYKTTASNYSADDEEFDNQALLTEGQSLYDYLLEQIRLTNVEDEDLKIAEYIIGNLDNDGYLRRELKKLVDDMAFSQGIFTTVEHVEYILENYVQKLDPAGVGARDLQECLLLQIEKKVSSDKAVRNTISKKMTCVMRSILFQDCRRAWEVILIHKRLPSTTKLFLTS